MRVLRLCRINCFNSCELVIFYWLGNKTIPVVLSLISSSISDFDILVADLQVSWQSLEGSVTSVFKYG